MTSYRDPPPNGNIALPPPEKISLRQVCCCCWKVKLFPLYSRCTYRSLDESTAATQALREYQMLANPLQSDNEPRQTSGHANRSSNRYSYPCMFGWIIALMTMYPRRRADSRSTRSPTMPPESQLPGASSLAQLTGNTSDGYLRHVSSMNSSFENTAHAS